MADMRQGAAYLWGFPGMLLIVLIGTLVRLLVWPGSALLPIMVTRYFQGGALQLAWLQAAGGLGLVLGGVILAAWGVSRHRVLTAMIALALDGVAISVIGLAPPDGLPIAIAAFFCSGFVEPFVFGPLMAVFQVVVPPALQGRVLGLVGAAGAAAAPVGMLLAGPIADAAGVQIWFIVGGLATTAMGIGAMFVPAIMQIERCARQESLPQGTVVP
jgi:DHA3 family macrolide efflux protein-like MFS transporter